MPNDPKGVEPDRVESERIGTEGVGASNGAHPEPDLGRPGMEDLYGLNDSPSSPYPPEMLLSTTDKPLDNILRGHIRDTDQLKDMITVTARNAFLASTDDKPLPEEDLVNAMITMQAAVNGGARRDFKETVIGSMPRAMSRMGRWATGWTGAFSGEDVRR